MSKDYVEEIKAMLAARRPGDVVTLLESVSALALEGLQEERRDRALQQAGCFNAQDFVPLCPDLGVGNARCSVLARKGEDGRRAYLVEAEIRGCATIIGACESVPTAAMLGELLLGAGVIQAPPSLGDEWAINVNAENPFESNFPDPVLRDCAFDELILDGKATGDSDEVVVFFKIDGPGNQSDEDYMDVEAWIDERGLLINPNDAEGRARDISA